MALIDKQQRSANVQTMKAILAQMAPNQIEQVLVATTDFVDVWKWNGVDGVFEEVQEVIRDAIAELAKDNLPTSMAFASALMAGIHWQEEAALASRLTAPWLGVNAEAVDFFFTEVIAYVENAPNEVIVEVQQITLSAVDTPEARALIQKLGFADAFNAFYNPKVELMPYANEPVGATARSGHGGIL